MVDLLNVENPLLSFLALSLISFLVCCLFFFFLFSNFYRQQQAPTKTPSPQSYPIIGNLIGFLRNRHRFHDWVSDMLSQTPSSTLQVNSFLNLSHGVCTANPINLQHLLHSNFPNYIKGSRYHDVLHDLLGYGIFSVDAHLWTLQRKISSHEFNTKSLKHFISDVVTSQLSDTLVPFLSNACKDNQIIDLQETLQKFTFSNICKVAFGVDITSMDNSGFVKAFDDAVEICSSRFLSPVPTIWKIKRLLNLGSEKRFKQAIKVVNDFALEIIKSKEKQELQNYKENTGKNQDLLSRFTSKTRLEMEFEDEEKRRKFLRDIVISFILAGKDSTSTALTWFFWLINGHPRCVRLILDEVVALEGFNYDEFKKLNYLHAALSESLRLFPPVPINSRLTVNDDVWPDGTYVGKGWFADYSAYAMGRMEKVWGPDCREFKPERWLDDDGVFQPSDQFKFPVFHCGPRMCLGKDMAYVQMKTIVVALMREFEIIAVDGGASAEKMMNPPYTLSLLLKMRGGFHVRLQKRRDWQMTLKQTSPRKTGKINGVC
ncbi:cytochrome P450 94A1-like [Durio zibethinus]|uniref:Cytochrome P450 94A1-like n=1 Tax=Durio zibethinus TaxID=66656 RepID=A0A6P5XNW7_DURZI|nr:cytochrome P450 94A1-like [Durio zibethinus]